MVQQTTSQVKPRLTRAEIRERSARRHAACKRAVDLWFTLGEQHRAEIAADRAARTATYVESAAETAEREESRLREEEAEWLETHPVEDKDDPYGLNADGRYDDPPIDGWMR